MAKSRINYFRHYLSFQLGRLKACTVFSIIFSALGFPALITAEYLSAHTKAYDPLVIALYVICVIAIIGCAAMSFITPVISFKHLYTKVNADNILSLPLTTNQRFFADVSSVYISFHLPFAISTALSVLLEIAICSANNWNVKQEYFYAIAVLGIAIMFSMLNIAVMTCCGRIIEAILYPILVNIVMPLLITFGGYISFKNCLGLVSGIEYEILASPLFLMWPVGSLISIESFLYLYMVAPIATLIYLAAAFLGYKFRRAENIGKPFVFKPAYMILSTLVALALITGYTYLSDYATIEGDNIIPSALTLGLMLLILMLIIEIIQSKKIKNIPAFAARFGITLVGGLLLCFGLLLTKGFGAGYYVPKAEDIKSISVANYGGYGNGFYNQVYSDEVDIIRLVTEEHGKIIESADKWEGDDQAFNIHYTLNNGRQVYRVYDSGFVSDNFWNRIFTSEGYRVSDIDRLNFDRSLGDDSYYASCTAIRLINQHTAKTYIELNSEALKNELIEALEKDLRADTEFDRHNENPVGILQIGKYVENFDYQSEQYANDFRAYYYFDVYESYTNTIELLSKYATVPTAEESLDDSVKNAKVYTLVRKKLERVDDSFTEFMFSSDCEAVFITEEEFRELVQYEAGYQNTSDDGYVYSVSRGISHLVPSSYEYGQEFDYTQMLNDIGMYYDNYEFLEDFDSMYNATSLSTGYINEEINSRCAEIFESRDCFNYFYYELNQ